MIQLTKKYVTLEGSTPICKMAGVNFGQNSGSAYLKRDFIETVLFIRKCWLL